MSENTVKQDIDLDEAIKDGDTIIKIERKHLKLSAQNPGTGLAISGGGIRSASFGLGVMQALVNNKQLSKVDYMSTVSGGGYLGAALTWALKQGGKLAGTDPERFPLGKRGKHTKKEMEIDVEGEAEKTNDLSGKNANSLLDFIRLHGSYLTPTSALDIMSVTAVVLRSMFMSLFVYFSFFTVAMTLGVWLLYLLSNNFLHLLPADIYQLFEHNSLRFKLDNSDKTKGVMIFVGLVILAIIVIIGLLFSISTFFSSEKIPLKRYTRFITGQKSIGFMFKLSLTCFVLGSLPYAVSMLQGASRYLVPSGSTLFGTLVGLWQYKKAHNKEENNSVGSDMMIYAGAIGLFYGVLLFAYIASTNIFLAHDSMRMVRPGLFIALVVISLLFGWLVNLNLIGPHYLWRNRLMEAFMPNKDAIKNNEWQASTEADSALMEDMCDEDNPRPYHIINTNVILANSPIVRYSGRGGDNFIISPLFCGSDATGWKFTDHFQKFNNRGMTLATAMATSAAALNPNAGVSGEGVTRNTVVSLLLAMLNLRLGYWTINPGMNFSLGPPNFFVPVFSSELLRKGLTGTNRYIQLSDGGHYENLGIYELIKRKLKLIIVSDGGADPFFNFDDLANAIEKVRVDFGAKISFRKGYETGDILPGTSGIDAFQKKYSIAKHGFAIADITYNDGKKGELVYMKLAMIEGLPTDVFSYKGIYPDFPHQSTADQFFDEKQFEAYRELGYYVGWQMMESEPGQKIFTS